jgi:hypothetical protein
MLEQGKEGRAGIQTEVVDSAWKDWHDRSGVLHRSVIEVPGPLRRDLPIESLKCII